MPEYASPGPADAAAHRPDFSGYRTIPGNVLDASASGLTVSWLGVSSLLIRTTRATVLVDGYFSRPELAAFAGSLAPDPERIEEAIAMAVIDRLDAVVVVHSHIDHAFDSPLIAQRFGCRLIGSESTMNIARGYGVAESLFDPVRDGSRVVIGDLEISLTTCEHCPGDVAPGTIDEPLVPPADFRQWRSAECFTLSIGYAGRRLVIQASANSAGGKLAGITADAVLLGIGQLANQGSDFAQEYWDELVVRTGTPVVFPIHWDDFMVPLRPGPQQPQTYRSEDAQAALESVLAAGRRDDIEVLLPEACDPFDPFAWATNRR